MRALAYLILGLLAAAQYTHAGCGLSTTDGTCDNDFYAVYSDSPTGPNIVCIKPDKEADIMTYEEATKHCNSLGGFLAEPIGYLHESIYDLIMCKEYFHEAFWIGGTDDGHQDYWKWETSGLEMPRSTPHWYPCEPRQPLVSESANHACIWEPDFYFYSCTEGIKILALCQKYPNISGG